MKFVIVRLHDTHVNMQTIEKKKAHPISNLVTSQAQSLNLPTKRPKLKVKVTKVHDHAAWAPMRDSSSLD
nr:Biomphalaria glabrata BTB/POZ domain-containing protein KCTD4-like; transcript variant X4 [Biomphalaria glabrata]